ncbi:enoyl-CoA hydratase/isomerase family protein [Cupriavidus basilensis]|uniref:enoyl-CoA hydratase/isomerase family protein n=1 Tax=Cupriavidus basilensis TaxID=68895 RepID=UPI002679010A
MQQSEGVSWGVAGHIGRITLSRPERANSLTLAASRALVRAIGEVLESKPRVVLLAAQGRIFCAGGSIDEFVAAGTALDTLVDDILTPLHPALYRLATAPMPVVAALSGPVAGAGIGCSAQHRQRCAPATPRSACRRMPVLRISWPGASARYGRSSG